MSEGTWTQIEPEFVTVEVGDVVAVYQARVVERPGGWLRRLLRRAFRRPLYDVVPPGWTRLS